jgi:chromosome segregation ATPase
MNSTIMRLVSVEVSNFKSFSRHAQSVSEHSHLIGPFLDRSAIVGPNGVGKSNIFDAIAFALNLDLSSRKQSIKKLAHRRPNSKPESSHADDLEFFVKLNFLKFKDSTDSNDDSKGEQFSVQRGLRVKNKDRLAVESPQYFNEFIINNDHQKPLLLDEYL